MKEMTPEARLRVKLITDALEQFCHDNDALRFEIERAMRSGKLPFDSHLAFIMCCPWLDLYEELLGYVSILRADYVDLEPKVTTLQ